jgi:hypothetical protein
MVSHPGMRKLMKSDGKKQRRSYNQIINELVHNL